MASAGTLDTASSNAVCSVAASSSFFCAANATPRPKCQSATAVGSDGVRLRHRQDVVPFLESQRVVHRERDQNSAIGMSFATGAASSVVFFAASRETAERPSIAAEAARNCRLWV